MQLVERGAVSLDKPVRSYLPSVPYDDALLVRHLLAYTGGVPNPLPTRWLHRRAVHNNHDEAAALAAVLADNDALKFTPGEKYLYSNLGYWLLGEIVEAVSGQDIADYFAEQIAKPLGVATADLAFAVNDERRVARGHQRNLRRSRPRCGDSVPRPKGARARPT